MFFNVILTEDCFQNNIKRYVPRSNVMMDDLLTDADSVSHYYSNMSEALS